MAMFLVPKTGWLGISRYDLLLIFAVAVQAAMLYFKLETWDEVKSITLFHLVGFALEWFKTSGDIQSWSYPDEAYTKIGGVPQTITASPEPTCDDGYAPIRKAASAHSNIPNPKP